MSGSLPSTSGVRLAIAWLLIIGYGAFVASVAFWPTPVDRPIAGLLERVLDELHERGVPGFIDYGFVEFSANVAFFVPVGVAIGLMLPVRWFGPMFLVGPVLSVAVESVQHLLLAARYATVHDVIANSIGSTIGVAVALLARALVAHRDDRVIARWEAGRAASVGAGE